MNRKKTINEVVDINGSKVFVEDGEVKVILNERIQKNGWMTLEELRSILHAEIEMIYKLP